MSTTVRGWDGGRVVHFARWTHGGASSKRRGRSDVARRREIRGEGVRSRRGWTKKGHHPPLGSRTTGVGNGGSKSAASLSLAGPSGSPLNKRSIRTLLPALYLPGGTHRFTDPGVISAAAWRAPSFFALFFLLVLSADADLHPYSPSPGRLQMCYGPSMMPTFAPYGDTVLRDSLSHRLPCGWKRKWQKGDVVVFVDYKGQLACKRIVAVGEPGGEVRVQRHGQFVEKFADQKGWGVPDPTKVGSPTVPHPTSWDSQNSVSTDQAHEQEIIRTVAVPDGHVWLEGDCPELSVDSRQYGPVPTYKLRGRIVARLWPLDQRAEQGEKSVFLSHNRPKPIPIEELIDDNCYNLKVMNKQPKRS